MTLGASGVVFGWLAYLIARGFYTRAPGQIALGVVVFFFYGGALLGSVADRATHPFRRFAERSKRNVGHRATA